DLVGESTSPDNALDFSFTIFLIDAKDGDTISVGVGLLIGTSSIWTAMQNITVTAGSLTPAPGNPSAWVAETISNTTVDVNGTVTFGARATIPTGANALVDCTITGDADSVVCGVSYGEVGYDIAYLPDLSELVVFTTPDATFQVNINSTGGTSNDIVFEVSVHYYSSPGSVTMTCAGGLSETFTATAGNTALLDMTGETASIAADTTWYLGSQAGMEVTLQFPVNSISYDPLVLESASDLSITGWGAKVCKVEVMSAGKGVPCIAGQMSTINQNALSQKA
ncbi:hypothetical protein SK128_020967, partial [Halocaridina rubra]